ncbi:hypothetical protein SPKIRA_37910 (plasmid) [Sphingomonas paucimobilis]|uniref:DUF6118 family protein n=1 Tax=Sphingomonas paucimobilis TaxID=13689 RepID=UPI0015DC685F|nr:DUF6118 family protein [Sphingomonas paucimobilis]BCI72961.1 hypothetical protein SPKIRA_37910 [Sphingomonas paucimobilis]
MSHDDHEPDAAVEAFEQIRGEMALMRRAVERLAAERAEVPQIPDYSETLGRMAKALNATMQNVGVLAKAAEDNVAPRHVADRIVAAGANARDEDRRMIASAGEKMDRATTALHGIGGVARRADEQRRTLWQVGAGACLGGMLLWTVVPGVVARALPDRWQVPEWMAARTLDLPKWEAGQRLMRAAGPDAFANIAAGDRIVTANRVVLEACQKRANKAGETVPCTVRIASAAK